MQNQSLITQRAQCLAPKESEQLNWSSSETCNTHRLSSRLRLTPCHTCQCPWWSSHGTGIFSILGSQQAASPLITSWPLFQNSALSQGAKCQLLSMTSSTLHLSWCQNQYHLGDSHTLPSLAASRRYSLGLLWTKLLCSDPGKCSQRIFPSMMLVFSQTPLILQLDSTRFNCPSETKASLQLGWSCAAHRQFLAPTDQKQTANSEHHIHGTDKVFASY